MHLKIIFSSETFATVITFVVQNFEMLSLLMHPEIVLLGETDFAKITFEGLFSRVNPHMVEELAHAFLCVTAALVLTLEELEQSRLVQLFQKEIYLVVSQLIIFLKFGLNFEKIWVTFKNLGTLILSLMCSIWHLVDLLR